MSTNQSPNLDLSNDDIRKMLDDLKHASRRQWVIPILGLVSLACVGIGLVVVANSLTTYQIDQDHDKAMSTSIEQHTATIADLKQVVASLQSEKQDLAALQRSSAKVFALIKLVDSLDTKLAAVQKDADQITAIKRTVASFEANTQELAVLGKEVRRLSSVVQVDDVTDPRNQTTSPVLHIRGNIVLPKGNIVIQNGDLFMSGETRPLDGQRKIRDASQTTPK